MLSTPPAIQHLVFVSLESWDEIWRRNQFVCATLIERNPKLKILFVQPALDVSNALRTGRLKLLLQPRQRTIGADERIVCTRAWKLLPNSWTWTRKLNEWMLRRHVQSVSRRLGFRNPVLWLNPHDAVHMAGRLQERSVIYDITDDWSELTQSTALRKLTIAQDAELCQRADAVIVCSEKLFEKKKLLARNLHLVPNGVDAAHYARVLDATGPLPPEAAAWRHPVLGYTGTIHPDRVDVNLVEKIARRFAGGTVALVGPMMLSEAHRGRIEGCGNIVMTGAIPYERLPELMRAFDVCITPHRVTPFTESLNPIKLWEYLAAGKPIVSANVAGFRDYPQHVRVSTDHDDFIRGLHEALAEDPRKSEARRAEAAGHSWQARADQIETIIDKATRKGSLATSQAEEDVSRRARSVRPPAEWSSGGIAAGVPNFSKVESEIAGEKPATAREERALHLISAIIISYNTRGMTLDCLRTLHAEFRGIESEIILVDNASGDGSAEAVAEEFPAVRVIANATNNGFGAANNQAMKEARGQYFLLLNSDAFPRPGAIGKLVQYLEQHLEVGVVGPRLLNADGSMQLSCFRFPTPQQAWCENLWVSSMFPEHPVLGNYRRWPHDAERGVDWIVGACMLMRREVFEQIGGFDESFFLYAEETDWQRRMRDGGWEIAFTPAAVVTHLGGASGASEKARINRHFFDGLDRYERKHHGLAGLISLRCAMTIGCGFRAVLWAITWLLRPRRRELASSKARLHSWLVLRQATHWR